MKIVLVIAAVFVLAACPRDDRPAVDTPAPGMAPAPTTPPADPMPPDTLRDTLRQQPPRITP